MTQPLDITEPRVKAFTLELTKDATKEDDGIGRFTGIASAVGVLDRHNEVIEKGAFDATLSAKGDTFPLLWQHDPGQPIGVIKLSTDKRGDLVAKGEINLKVSKGVEAYELLKQGAINAMSIGFNIPENGAAFVDGVLRILSVDMWETSLVTFPANPGALIDSVKRLAQLAEEAKAGRVLSKKNRDGLVAAKEAIEAVLEADTPSDPDAGKDVKAPHPIKTEMEAVKALVREMKDWKFHD